MIRKATLNDVSFIYKLSKENLESIFKKETLEDYIIEDETNHIFVYEKDELIGFIIIWESDEYGQIIDLVVKDDDRRKGYGKDLIEYSIDYLKSINVKSLSLEVSENNKRAIKLYKKMGFKKERILKNYYKNSNGFLYVRSL